MRAVVACVAVLGFGCEVPTTLVVVQNDYPTTSDTIVYRAFWQAVRFDTPLAPSDASDPFATVPASDNRAYAVLAPGFDPTSTAQPSVLVVLQAINGFAVDLDDTLDIPIDDSTFAGDCAAESTLSQAQADFITERVFQDVFAGLTYDAATCTVSTAP